MDQKILVNPKELINTSETILIDFFNEFAQIFVRSIRRGKYIIKGTGSLFKHTEKETFNSIEKTSNFFLLQDLKFWVKIINIE